ncbi:MAG: hypothetical protein J1F20_07985 [Muribaculaceae bacterium]|nr:hypothetical protein [Muribaculaceae bacterium]
MAKISPLDLIFVTVIQRGITCLRTSCTGISSISDIVAKMRQTDPTLTGMVTLDVRNSTEGWASRHSLCLI